MTNYIKYILLLICIFAFPDLNGQDTTFICTYGGTGYEQGRSIQRTYDNGFIMVGSTGSFGNGNSDIYMVKTDSVGIYQWSKTYGGVYTDWGLKVEQTADSGFVIAGYTNSFGSSDYDIYIVRTNSIGDTIWTKRYGSIGWDFGNDIKQTPDGGFILAGQISNQSGTGKDALLMKIDTLGDTLWTKTYGGTKDETFNSIALTVDGGYIMTGYTSSYGNGKKDTYTVKTNDTGDTLWTFIKGDADDDIANKIIQVSDTGYAIIGTHKSFVLVPDWKKDFYFIKLDKNGNFVRHDSWGSEYDDYGQDIIELPTNELAALGYIPEFNDIYLAYTSSNGNWQFGHTYGGNGDQKAYSIDFTSNGGFAIFGTTTDYGSGYSDFYLLTTDSTGKDQDGIAIINYDPDSVFLDTHHILITSADLFDFENTIYEKVYPTPSSNNVTIELPHYYSSNLNCSFELLDIMGNVIIRKRTIENRIFKVHKGNLSNGIYFVRIKIQNKDKVEYRNAKIIFSE